MCSRFAEELKRDAKTAARRMVQAADELQCRCGANAVRGGGRCLTAESLSVDQLLGFACSSTSGLVQLGLRWLRERELDDEDRTKSLVLIDAKCEAHREALLEWMVATLRGCRGDSRGRLLELLDSRRDDVRKASWSWFVEDESLRQDVQLWQQLMESPYSDVRLVCRTTSRERVAERMVPQSAG